MIRMVFNRLRESLKKNSDPFSPRGLEQFNSEQKQRIFKEIKKKELEIIDMKANSIISKRIAKLERKAGLIEKKNSGVNIVSGFNKFKKFRQKNLERNEEKDKRSSGSLKIKSVDLKAP